MAENKYFLKFSGRYVIKIMDISLDLPLKLLLEKFKYIHDKKKRIILFPFYALPYTFYLIPASNI